MIPRTRGTAAGTVGPCKPEGAWPAGSTALRAVCPQVGEDANSTYVRTTCMVRVVVLIICGCTGGPTMTCLRLRAARTVILRNFWPLLRVAEKLQVPQAWCRMIVSRTSNRGVDAGQPEVQFYCYTIHLQHCL